MLTMLHQLVHPVLHLRARARAPIQGRMFRPIAVSTATRRFSYTVRSRKISVIWKVRMMPILTSDAGLTAVIGRPSKIIAPSLGGKKPLIRLNRVVLPAPFGPMTARNSPGSTRQRNIVQRRQRAEAAGDIFQPQQAHDRLRRRKNPSTPSGKNITDSTKTRPITVIQFCVIALT